MLKVVPLTISSHGLLLCVAVSLLWGVVNAITTPFPGSSRSTEARSTAFTTVPVPRPDDVHNVTPVTQNESSITLSWDKVNNISTYTLKYEHIEENVTAPGDGTSVQHVVSSLNAGRRYSFTLITVYNGLNSSGYTFNATTAPQNTKNVSVVTQSKNNITLLWEKVNNISNYKLRSEGNGTVKEENITVSGVAMLVEHVVSNLTAGRKYSFTLFTEYDGISSSGYSFMAATAPRNVKNFTSVGQNETSITLQWSKVNDIQAYRLVFGHTVKNLNTSVLTHTVSELASGTEYHFTLLTVFETVTSSGRNRTAVTAPENVKNVTVVNQTESSVTLQWEIVNGTSYMLEHGSIKVLKPRRSKVFVKPLKMTVTHTINRLNAGTKYRLTLITVFKTVNSTGYTFDVATVPPAVKAATVAERSVDAITLNWTNTNRAWTYTVLIVNRSEPVDTANSSDQVSHTVKSLHPGTKYRFQVITTFSGLKSSAHEVVTVTAIDCSRVNWHVSSSSIHGTVEGLFTSATATNNTGSRASEEAKNVSFTGLYPGASYEITLEYLDSEVSPTALTQCSHNIHLVPSSIRKAKCHYWGSGYSIRVEWDTPSGLWTQVEVNVTGKVGVLFDSNDKQHAVIAGFQPAQTYEVSVGLLSGSRRSEKAFVFDCLSDPRGVIAGAVIAVLLLILLVCAAVVVFLKRPNLLRKKPFIGGSKLSTRKVKALPISKFPEHFMQMSLDENRGFGQEYENLKPVGTEQARRAAVLPENKDKNRFSNVLPYDWSRVKLMTENGKSDYINASYMPGYNSSREYIASQGPLPTTANDFWRMIWEQRVKGIVMVTNCTESGKIKCEQYWPDGSQPHLYGELRVTTAFQTEETSWTLREFSIRHKSTSEERTVKHFHFTAWPDHGVPQGTEVLVQFRQLMRQHIEKEGKGAPTVVHCSAGVGRTGTIITLDVLLQQLEKERAVGINAFVHKLRLSRPHMVQTESQYIFLHQCIMDLLQPKQSSEEHLYENVDMIYVNATALRQLR